MQVRYMNAFPARFLFSLGVPEFPSVASVHEREQILNELNLRPVTCKLFAADCRQMLKCACRRP